MLDLADTRHLAGKRLGKFKVIYFGLKTWAEWSLSFKFG